MLSKCILERFLDDLAYKVLIFVGFDSWSVFFVLVSCFIGPNKKGIHVKV